jgi:S-adenosylmethionine/arginine decarboxylase-like enzyme
MGPILEHKHLILNASINNPPLEKDVPFMTEWFRELIESINMKILMGPYVVYSNMVGNRGFTGVTVIETSHTALHIWDECKPAVMKLDVYTCSSLDLETIFNKIEVFSPINMEYVLLDREDTVKVLADGKRVFT